MVKSSIPQSQEQKESESSYLGAASAGCWEAIRKLLVLHSQMESKAERLAEDFLAGSQVMQWWARVLQKEYTCLDQLCENTTLLPPPETQHCAH